MADFKVKNGLQAKRYLQTTTALASTATAIDLSKGNNFSITPSGNPTFTFTNPPATGKAQAFSVEVTGGSNGVDEIFSIDLWDGTGQYSGTRAEQTITNGIDFSTHGGMVYIKGRGTGTSNGNRGSLFSTPELGVGNFLYTAQNNAKNSGQTSNTYLHTGPNQYNTDGFKLGDERDGWGAANDISTPDYVGYSFRKASKFFDIVSYTGNGTAGKTISHDLGEAPGMIWVKRIDATANWSVYHRGANGGTDPEDYHGILNLTDEFSNNAGHWNDTAPTTTQFTVGDDTAVNASGGSYVAYLYSHNSDKISCGSYTGNGSATGPTVDVGFQPQWVMFKLASHSGEEWILLDSKRGINTDGNDARLEISANTPESNSANFINLTSTGFQVTSTSNSMNTNGRTYIYTAIATGGAGSLTWPTSVKYPGGTAPSSPALGKKDVFTFMTVDGGTSYVGKKAVEGLE